MNTIQIQGYNLTITPELEQATLELYGYYCQPAQVRYRTDPKCKMLQILDDEFVGAFWEAVNDQILDEESGIPDDILEAIENEEPRDYYDAIVSALDIEETA